MVASCKDFNFPVDESTARAFHPSTLSASSSKVTATTAVLEWPIMPGTKNYIMELSRDSLLFQNIVSTYTISADTIPPSWDLIDLNLKNLIGGTTYSARLKTTSSAGYADSKYITVTFKTKTEQIMSPVLNEDIGLSYVTVKWIPGSEVTNLLVKTDGKDPVQIDLSDAEKAAGAKYISGLSSLTTYTVEIYNTAINKRGSVTFKTVSGPPSEGTIIMLAATDSIHKILSSSTDTKLTLVLPKNSIYAYDINIKFKEGVSVTFWGEPGGAKPIIAFNGFTLPAAGGTFKFENVDLTGYQYSNGVATTTKRNYIFNQSTASLTDSVIFEGCIIRNFVNTPFRTQGANTITIDKLVYNNCIAYDCSNNGSTGTYSFISENTASCKINNIRITNSTIYNIGYNLILHTAAASQSVYIDHCTFNDITGDGRYFIDYNTNAVASFTLSNCIFGKTKSPANTAKGIRIGGTTVTSLNCFQTSDFSVTGNAIGGTTLYPGASTALFKDPSSGNFQFLDGNFAGLSYAGDPRWKE